MTHATQTAYASALAAYEMIDDVVDDHTVPVTAADYQCFEFASDALTVAENALIEWAMNHAASVAPASAASLMNLKRVVMETVDHVALRARTKIINKSMRLEV